MKKKGKVFGTIVFLFIIGIVFFRLSYLFRGSLTDFGRKNVMGLMSEPDNSCDVIFVGASATYMYFQPYKAFEKYGISSYDIASSGLKAESILPFVKQARKTQKDAMFVIDMRPFQYYSEKKEDNKYRFEMAADSMPYGYNRFVMIEDIVKKYGYDYAERIAFHFDLASRHSADGVLNSYDAWIHSNNRFDNNSRGFYGEEFWAYLEEPVITTEERRSLVTNAERTFRELASYIVKNSLPALFVVCPYAETEEDRMIYNTLEDISAEYGIEFLNANKYYREIGIDFSHDFADINHVNCYGADKYTDFIGQYLVEKYFLPDHRNEEEYDSWYEKADAASQEISRKKSIIDGQIWEANYGTEVAKDLVMAENFCDWGLLAEISNFSLIAVGNADKLNFTAADRKMLDNIGMGAAYGRKGFAGISVGGDLLGCNTESNSSVSVTNMGTSRYLVSAEVFGGEEISTISIEDKILIEESSDCFTIFVYDNAFRKIVDRIELDNDDEGNVIIKKR